MINKPKSLAAYYAVYKNKRATEFVLDNFRKFFPDEKVILISDGGISFEDVANKYKCEYFYFENIFGNEINNYPKYPYNSYRMLEWWKRQKLVCDLGKADYNIILEDDVLVRNKFEIFDEFHLRGIRFGSRMSNRMIEDIKNYSGLDSHVYGMCGGSIYNCNTFLSIYQSVVDDININHDMLISTGQYYVLGAVDANITYHFNKRGYKYEISPWLVEVMEGDLKDYPIIHQYKELYNEHNRE